MEKKKRKKKGGVFQFEQTWIHFSQECFVPVWFKYPRRFFKISLMYFRYFIIISPWKRVRPFIWANLNLRHPRILCAKFGENWLSGSGEGDFHSFVIICSWKGSGPSLEQIWIPGTQAWFVPSLVEIGPVVLIRKKKMWKITTKTTLTMFRKAPSAQVR